MRFASFIDVLPAHHGLEKDLAERTLTKLYHQRPAWLVAAHKALNLERSAG